MYILYAFMKNLEKMTKKNRQLNVIPSCTCVLTAVNNLLYAILLFGQSLSPTVQFPNQALQLNKEECVQMPNSWT